MPAARNKVGDAPRPKGETRPVPSATKAAKPVGKKEDTQLRVFGALPLNSTILRFVVSVWSMLALIVAAFQAYQIRMHAIRVFGYVIHEFDPWFNFRATQYLSKHGWSAFFSWFDHMSWYPLGRPVGTTIYPGLQIASVAIHRALRWMGKGWRLSLNDVCCLMPAWGGAATTVTVYLLAREVTSSATCAAVAALTAAVIPSHLMRTMAGGYDNECIAILAMSITFLLWVRSVRTNGSWPIAVAAGLAYGFMVAAWGGFIFVLNMIALHAVLCFLGDWSRGEYRPGLLYAYTCFYTVGTLIATRVPVVGMTPFKSLEQLAALLVLMVLAAIHLAERTRKSHRPVPALLSVATLRLRIRFACMLAAILVAVAFQLVQTGYFGPLSSRVRALFVQHTKTGNPLVDSVAEHRPPGPGHMWRMNHVANIGWLLGPLLCAFRMRRSDRFHARLFVVVYALVGYYFVERMSRLMIIVSPCVAIASGVTLGRAIEWSLSQLVWSRAEAAEEERQATLLVDAEHKNKSGGKGGRHAAETLGPIETITATYAAMRTARFVIAVIVLFAIFATGWGQAFIMHCESSAKSFGHPRFLFQHEGRIIDDYQKAYRWVRDNTAPNARVMAWWDYGYQIAGMGQRATIADGNTWNHEHIATLGYCLTSPVMRAHTLIRHVADYVLVWTGGQGDDLAKSPHMARIGNSVYRDICPNDPMCAKFGFFDGPSRQQPTPMMKNSLLYHLSVVPGQQPWGGAGRFKLVFQSQHGLARVWKVLNVSEESREYLDNPANWNCDAPGSWYCPGNYPNAEPWQKLLAKRRDFGQLEDFNRKKKDSDYHTQYMKSRH